MPAEYALIGSFVTDQKGLRVGGLLQEGGETGNRWKCTRRRREGQRGQWKLVETFPNSARLGPDSVHTCAYFCQLGAMTSP
jgi:hypothetical protein